MNIPLVKMSLPQSTLAKAKPLVGFDYGDAFYHVLLFDFGDDGGAIGVWREGDNFCARITLDALAQFNAQAKEQKDVGDTRRVVCAAIRSASGDVLLGIRHYSKDMHVQMRMREDGSNFRNRLDPDQGFVDQHGVYMSREEAYQVASDANQIINAEACGMGLDGPKLYSEGLY